MESSRRDFFYDVAELRSILKTNQKNKEKTLYFLSFQDRPVQLYQWKAPAEILLNDIAEYRPILKNTLNA